MVYGKVSRKFRSRQYQFQLMLSTCFGVWNMWHRKYHHLSCDTVKGGGLTWYYGEDCTSPLKIGRILRVLAFLIVSPDGIDPHSPNSALRFPVLSLLYVNNLFQRHFYFSIPKRSWQSWYLVCSPFCVFTILNISQLLFPQFSIFSIKKK